MLCVWWDQKGVIYWELLKPGDTQRYRQQMTDLDRVLRFAKTTQGDFAA